MNPVVAIVRPAEQRIFKCAHGLTGHWDGPCTICDTLNAEKKAEQKEKHRIAGREYERKKREQNQRPVDNQGSVENTQQSDAATSADARKALYEQEEDDESDSPEVMRRRGLFNRAEEAIRLARYDDLIGIEVDQDMLRLAMNAVEAWTDVLTKLKGEYHG